MKILIFGDSIVEGFNGFKFGGWAKIMKKECDTDKKGVSVGTFGIAGDTVVDVIGRFDFFASKFTEGSDDEIIIILAVGINDTITNQKDTEFSSTENKFEKNYSKLVKKAKTYTDRIYTIGLTKVDEKLVSPFKGSLTGKCYKNERIEKFDKIIQKLSEKNNTTFIELFTMISMIDLDDGLHPNTAGHKRIFNKIKEIINY